MAKPSDSQPAPFHSGQPTASPSNTPTAPAIADSSASLVNDSAGPSHPAPSPAKTDSSAPVAKTLEGALLEQNQMMGSHGMNDHTRAPQPSTASSLSPSIGGAPTDKSGAQSQSTATPAVADMSASTTTLTAATMTPKSYIKPSKSKIIKLRLSSTLLSNFPSDNKIFDFLNLPAELRNFIYHYSLDWNRVQGPMDAIKRTIEALPENDKDDVAARRDACIVEHDALLNSRQTPTILLLCKQVTSEAVSILHDIPLTLNFKPRDWVSRDQIFFVTERPYKAKEDKRMPVFKWAMMSRTTIKQVKKATFFIPNWGDGNITGDILQPWFYLLAMSGIFMQDDSSLEELRIEFSGPTGNGIGDLVWILDGRNKELFKTMWGQQLRTDVHGLIIEWLDRMALKGYLTAVHTPIQRQLSQ